MMKHSSWLRSLMAGASVVATSGIVAPVATHAEAWRFHYDHVLGTSLDIVAVAGSEGIARIATGAALAEIARLDRVLSAWRPDSELARLNTVAEAAVSPDLFAVVAACERWRHATGGAFSGRLGAVHALWRAAAARGVVPVATLLRAAAERAEAAEVLLHPTTRTVTRPDGVVFAVDGLAKGAIIDAALAAARRAAPGLAGLMIDIGGDLRCWGEAPQADGWRIGVVEARAADNAPPAAILAIADRAVATSGRGARDMMVAGHAHAHIVAPRSGLPVERVIAASVVAGDAATADALATAFSVMPAEESLALAGRLPGVETLLVAADGGRHASAGWQGLVREAASSMSSIPVGSLAQASAAPWPDGFALAVAYEIPKLDADVYRAPYVAIWITDEKRQLVRTLLLLGNEQRWIDSNYVWWRRYGRKIDKVVDTLSRPTRLPGRYAVDWDGLDDAGRPVGQGRYLIHIEAAREHGGHTYQMVELALGAEAADRALPAKDEIGTLQLRFGPRK